MHKFKASKLHKIFILCSIEPTTLRTLKNCFNEIQNTKGPEINSEPF